LLLTFGKTGLAALLLGTAAWVSVPVFLRLFPGDSLLHEGAVVVLSGGLSALVFIGTASLLRIEELRWLGGLLRSRLLR
jgi:hypothetical protein